MPFFALPTGGASPVIAGNGAPNSSLGNIGDLFIDTANAYLYGPKELAGWGTPIDLSQGPTGPSVTGPTGPAFSGNLSEIPDVALQNVTTGQVLAYDGTAWANSLAINASTGSVTINGGTSGSASLTLNCEQNTHGVTIQSPPHSAGATYTLTLPTSDGAANQVLQTDGSGVLSWADHVHNLPSLGELSDVTLDSLTLIQSGDGLQNFLWDGASESGYEVELIALNGTLTDATDITALSTAVDGSLTLLVETDATYVDGVVVAASADNGTTWEAAEYALAIGTSENLTVTGLYLPDSFTSAGNYTVAAALLDLDGGWSGDTGPVNITVAAHGSPVAPDIEVARFENSNLSVGVAAITNPHKNGFYDLANITYYLETTDGSSGNWARTAGISANTTATTPLVAIGVNVSTALYGRIVAENPLGEGEPSEIVEL